MITHSSRRLALLARMAELMEQEAQIRRSKGRVYKLCWCSRMVLLLVGLGLMLQSGRSWPGLACLALAALATTYCYRRDHLHRAIRDQIEQLKDSILLYQPTLTHRQH